MTATPELEVLLDEALSHEGERVPLEELMARYLRQQQEATDKTPDEEMLL
jgi:hypothetical protein